MKLPWSKKEKSKEELELEKLEMQAKLNDAKLKAAEVDEEVLKAVRINRLFSTLSEGARDLEEVEMRLRHYAEMSGVNVEYLKQMFHFRDSVKRLEELDEEALAKLEKLMKMNKEQKKLLGMG